MNITVQYNPELNSNELLNDEVEKKNHNGGMLRWENPQALWNITEKMT